MREDRRHQTRSANYIPGAPLSDPVSLGLTWHDRRDSNQTGFAILAGPGIEIMYQTFTRGSADLIASAVDPGAFQRQAQQGHLFVEVQDLAEIEHRLASERMVLPHRTTFYGAKELGYSDGAGNIIVFAQFTVGPAAE